MSRRSKIKIFWCKKIKRESSPVAEKNQCEGAGEHTFPTSPPKAMVSTYEGDPGWLLD